MADADPGETLVRLWREDYHLWLWFDLPVKAGDVIEHETIGKRVKLFERDGRLVYKELRG